jgi:hypothetical protein
MLINKLSNKINFININCSKNKINYLFTHSKFIIFQHITDIFYLKTLFLKYSIFSLILKERQIKVLFNLPNFSFLRGGQYLCAFVDDLDIFLNILKTLGDKPIFYSYKKILSNLIPSSWIVDSFNQYYSNYISILFILKKIKIKVIILFFFFLISFTVYIK